MRKSKALARMKAGEEVRICGLGHYLPAYIRHAAHFGFDCVWLDLEHRAMNDREVQALMALFHLYDIDCMLRPSTLEKTKLYRYLEDGAAGLMIPHVSTPEKAHMLAQSVKFPPIGDRGIDGAGMDSDFFLQGGEGYTDRANAETFLVVQIETFEAVENVDAIAAVPGVDGLFIGPGDLGLRIANSDTSLTMEKATERVAAAAKKHGKAWGRPAGTTEIIKQLRDQGAQLLAHGGEFMAIHNMLRDCSSNFDTACGPRSAQ